MVPLELIIDEVVVLAADALWIITVLLGAFYGWHEVGEARKSYQWAKEYHPPSISNARKDYRVAKRLTWAMVLWLVIALLILMRDVERVAEEAYAQAGTAILARVLLIIVIFLIADALRIKKAERDRWRKEAEEENGAGDNAISSSLQRIEESDEDRFSEGELEKHDVRERLDMAALVSREELEDVRRELREKMDKVIELLKQKDGADE